MKFRHTVQLGAILALLILMYFGLQLVNQQSATMVEEAKRLFPFEPEAVRTLEIHQVDSAPVKGVRGEDGVWSIVEPDPAIRPHQKLWDRVARHLAGLKSQRTLPDGAIEPKTSGLDVPRLTVTTEAAGQEHVLQFGYLEPTQSFRYARLDGGNVFLAEKDAVFELDRSLDILRESFLVDNVESPIVRFEFARYLTVEDAENMENPPPVGEESAVLAVERDGPDSPWMQVEPVHVAANGDRVNELVTEIRTARGRNYIDHPESYADYGLEPPVARITVMDAAEGHPQTFYFGDISRATEEGGVYVRKEGEDAVFVMDGHILSLFPRSTNTLRERRLLASLKSPTRIERTGASGKDYTLALDDAGRWAMVEPPLDDTDAFYVSQFINALKMLEGLRFYPGEPEEYGLDNPEAAFRFHLAGQEAPISIRLAPAADVEGHYYVLTDAGEVASLPEEHVRFLLTGPGAFRDRALVRFDQRKVVRVDFAYEDVAYTLEKVHNRWLVTAPADHYVPNQQDAVGLVEAVANLRATGAETTDEAAGAEYEFDTPRVTLSIFVAPPEGDAEPELAGTVTVGGIVPGLEQQRFARSSVREGVFRIPQTFVESVQVVAESIRSRPGTGGPGN